MEATRYSIGELAEAAGVTPRTIRFYTAEGLLPPPDTEGRYAVYVETHRCRLELIQRLKQAFLPLATIRAQMQSLTDTQVNELLARCVASRGDDSSEQQAVRVRATEPHDQLSTPEYIAQILAVTGQTREDNAVPSSSRQRRRALLVSPQLAPEQQSQAASETTALEQRHPSARDTWERVLLADGAELHLRVPVSPQNSERVERLIAAAKALFHAES